LHDAMAISSRPWVGGPITALVDRDCAMYAFFQVCVSDIAQTRLAARQPV